MDLRQIGTILFKKGLLPTRNFEIIPLLGGVSSEIFLLKDAQVQLVVKKALPRLKVKEVWRADTSRNRVEQAFITFVSRFQPEVVPKILFSDHRADFFAMEYLGSEYSNWKEQLLQGVFQEAVSRQLATILANIHTHSYGNETARKCFDTTNNFNSLRIEPYLLTTADRNPPVRELIVFEAKRLAMHRECLVHGDFSPKNVMVSTGRMVLLDHEVAWYGDPAFDLAFMLTHLHLKQFLQGPSFNELPDLATVFWNTYFKQYQPEAGNLKERSLRLWLMILLARIDGKSPVEYLVGHTDARQFIRSFVYKALLEGNFIRGPLVEDWYQGLNKYYTNEN